MSHKVHELDYFGDVRGICGHGKTVAFVTTHAEEKPTALYRIDGETNKLSSVGLPCGGQCLVKTETQYWIGGDDGVLYTVGDKDKSAKPAKIKLDSTVVAIGNVGQSLIALAVEKSVLLVDAKAKLVQKLEVEETVSSLAASPDGQWIAVGLKDGTVSVFQKEDRDDFELSESEKLHEGTVTALLFEPDELRFFSAGADRKLLLTHARGRLEPEDRGRANNHDKLITSMVHVTEDRFVTGSLDKSCKSWTRAGATKPQTQAADLVAVTGLALVTIHKRTNLVACCGDNSLRMFLVNDTGRIENLLTRYNDVYSKTAKLFESNEPSDRGQAMQDLADLDDRKSAELLAARISSDADNKLRLTAAKLIAKSNHPQLDELLKPLLDHQDGPVRVQVLETLEELTTKAGGSLVPLIALYQDTINLDKLDTGAHCIAALIKLAKGKVASDSEKNDIQSVLTSALDVGTPETRTAAVLGLEQLFDKKSTRPNLLTLESSNSDSRRKGLIRLMQRGLLNQPATESGLRRSVEDNNGDVRQTAFLISVLSRPKLAEALRTRDKDLDRQLKEVEKFDFGSGKGATKTTTQTKVPKKVAKKVAKKKVAKRKPASDAAALDPEWASVETEALAVAAVFDKLEEQLTDEPKGNSKVTITGFGQDKLMVVKVVKTITGLSLMNTKRLVESCPSVVVEGTSREAAESIVETIRNAGGTAELS